MNVRSNQGGSIASFIIIGVVLVIMTTGVLYWVRHKDAPTVRESPTPEVTLPGTDATTDNKNKKTTPAEDESSPATTDDKEATTPAEEAAPEAQADVTALSQTGPADTAFQLIAVGALAVAGISFVRSRNHAASL